MPSPPRPLTLTEGSPGIVSPMRIHAISAAVLGCLSLAQADTLVRIPTAYKTLKGTAKVRHLANQGAIGRGLTEVSLPVLEGFELRLGRIHERARGESDSISLSYQYLPPFTDTLPGIAFGIEDIADQTPQGRSAYAVVTWNLGLTGTLNQDVPAELTIGAGTNRYKGIFLGARVPFSKQFNFIIEHDSRDASAGIEIKPFQNVAVQWMFQQNRTQLGAWYVARF